MKHKVKKTLLIAAGIILLLLATIGLVLPILPTTPLVLLASFCFIRSSEKLYDWLIEHPLFGRYLRNYLLYKAVDRRSKRFAMLMLWSGLILSMLLVDKLALYIVLTSLGLAVSLHILKLRTMTAEQEAELCREDTKSQQQLSETIKVKS